MRLCLGIVSLTTWSCLRNDLIGWNLSLRNGTGRNVLLWISLVSRIGGLCLLLLIELIDLVLRMVVRLEDRNRMADIRPWCGIIRFCQDENPNPLGNMLILLRLEMRTVGLRLNDLLDLSRCLLTWTCSMRRKVVVRTRMFRMTRGIGSLETRRITTLIFTGRLFTMTWCRHVSRMGNGMAVRPSRNIVFLFGVL